MTLFNAILINDMSPSTVISLFLIHYSRYWMSYITLLPPFFLALFSTSKHWQSTHHLNSNPHININAIYSISFCFSNTTHGACKVRVVLKANLGRATYPDVVPSYESSAEIYGRKFILCRFVFYMDVSLW